MEIIRYKTEDFVMTVESHHIDTLYQRASRKITNINSSTRYQLAGVVGQLELWQPGDQPARIINAENDHHPVFFENSDYIFDVEFRQKVKIPRVYAKLEEITEKFSSKQRGELHTLTGTLNYSNDIGKYDFILRYEKAGVKKEFVLSFEIFPTKLDYKNDYRTIIKDIEKEYSSLVFDFLKKTYSNFKSDTSKGNDLIWWSIFGSVYKNLLHASRFILNKPHSRLISFEENCKAHQLKRLTPALGEKIVLNRHIPQKIYRTTNKRLTSDTTENRFFKFTIVEITRKYNAIKKFIEENRHYKISEEFQEELDMIESSLKKIKYHPFFRNIGDFKGLNQESLVLQKRAGYAEVYKNWILLKRGYSFFEGIQKIDMKNIADLYQIWCFLKMKGMIESILGKKPEHVELAEVLVDNFLFTLKKGKASRVEFSNDSGEKIELFHDYTYTYKGQSETHSYTVEQRPDIVLKISKSDLEDNYSFTYLYDAKYRLLSDENEDNPDFPPNDAINQMHRYRDAIYYLDKDASVKGKEVIGGYILFPGSGTVEDVKAKSFYTSIKDVNIGAFPLVPNDSYQSQQILQDHLREVIHAKAENILQDVIPQKGMIYEDPDAFVLAGFLRNDNQIKYFKSGDATIYHMPVYSKKTKKINCIRNLDKLKYFCPIIEGIEEYYEIQDIKVLPRKDIFSTDHPNALYSDSSESYYVFNLSNRRLLIRKIETATGGNRLFRYARLSELKKVTFLNEFNKVKQEDE